jgi:uncharacterized protein YggE
MNTTNNNLLHTIVIALAVLVAAYFISTRPVIIEDSSPYPTMEGWITMNSISVQGEGRVFADPDIFLLGLSVTSVATTSAEAQETTKTDIDEIRQLAEQVGIETKDIQTTQMSIYPEYNYSPTGESTIRGYRATHGLTLKIRELDQVDTVINQLTFSNNIQIQSMSYDIDDKTDLYTAARELWFEKAKQKASELAQLAGITLEKPLSISDQVGYNNPIYPPMPYQANVYREEMAMAGDSSVGAAINPGQLEVTVQVNVIYGVK